MKFYAWIAGCWFASMQMTLIYSMSFLHSATLPAYLSIMLSWFLGSAVGCWLPSQFPSWPLVTVAAVVHGMNTTLLSSGWLVGSWVVAGLLGGMAGGHWVRRWGERALAYVLSWESLGLASGFFFASLGIYLFGLGMIYFVPIGVTIPLVWRERGLYASQTSV